MFRFKIKIKPSLIILLLFLPTLAFATEEQPLKENTGQIGPLTYQRTPGTASSFLPDISLIGTINFAVFNDDPTTDQGDNPSLTGFNFREFELGVQSVVDPYVRADAFFSFAEEGVEVEEGYITTLALPANLQIRAGKMKIPFGRHNQKHSETWAFVTDPLVNHKIFGAEGFNELAFTPSVLFPLPFFLQLEGAFSQGDNENNFDGFSRQDFAYTGRLSTSVDLVQNLTMLAGTSAAFGFNNTGIGNQTSIYGGDLMFKWKPETDKGLQWENEYIYRRREILSDLETEGGFYSQVIGQWSKRWQAGTRMDLLGFPKNDEKDWRSSTMLKFMPTEFFALRAEFDHENSDIMRNVEAGYLQMIFSVGPHGAHKF